MKNLFCLLVLLLGMESLHAQSVKITGTITDASNAPVEGASVKIKGSESGTTTDSLGRFSISVPNRSVFLVFSHVNFNEKELTVGQNNTLNVTMQNRTNEGEEVVVIGYGTARKKDVTGSVGKVNMSDLDKAPVRSFDEALAGRTAGVQVSSGDGQPGSGISVVIRGNNSITQGNSPLYVVDGFPIEDPNNNVINPSDIESIEILKDASATAIYGARGANGVVMITTKKGKEGPARISFDMMYGVQEANRQVPLMDSYEYVRYMLELDTTSVSTTPYPTPKQIYLSNGKTLDDYKNVPATDWQGLVLQPARMSSYNLSINGGSKQTKYSISGSIFDQDGVLINSGYKRYQGRIVLDQQINQKLKVGINANYTYLEQSGISPSQNSFSGTNNVMVAVWGARPVNTSENSIEDDLIDPTFDPANDYRVNPVINLNNLVRINATKNLFVNAYAEYAIMNNLKLRVTGGITDNNLRNEQFNNSMTQFGNLRQPNGVNGSLAYANNNSWLNENTLTWNKTIKNHSLNILGGFTAQGGNSSRYGMTATQLPNEKLGVSGLDEGIVQPHTATSSNWTMASFLGRINYNYRSKYLLTASFRADGSSKFAESNHWSYFPSAAISWRFSEENWFGDNSILSDGKLRVSYGTTGNNRVADFAYMTTFGLPNDNSYVFNNTYVNGIVPTALGNTDLRWETTKQMNIGVDLGFFDDRIQLTVDAYKKTTSDLLLNAQLPGSSGFGSAFKNIGSVENSGLEFSLNTINIKKRNFSWSSSFNISFNQSEVVGLAENQESLTSAIRWDQSFQNVPAYIAKLGQPLGQIYGYIWDGVYTYNDFNRTVSGGYILKDNVPTNGNTRDKIQPGDIRYRDINGDLVVDAKDYTTIGRGLPVHFGGFTNNLTYKNFDLNIFFQWSYGNDILNANQLWFMGGRANNTMNQYASYNNRWSPDNQNTNIYRAKGYFGGGYSSMVVEDGSYLRLKTISLGYNFDANLLKKIKIRSLRAYVSAQNLLTWTNYSGLDPEVSAYNSALTPGFDFSTYPRARTISGGVKITF